MPIIFLFARMDGARTLLADGDTGWHIRTGQWIIANHRVPVKDIFSFTRAGQPWYAWEWLSDVIFALLNSHGGLATLLVFSVLVISISFALLFRLANRNANPLVAVVVTMVGAAASAIHWLARPHLFSLLFLVLFYRALESVRQGRERFHGVPLLAMLPVAAIVWTNLHGGFFVGILMLAGYGAGEMLNLLLVPGRSQGSRRRAGNYFLSAAVCSAASLVNPYFYRLHRHAFEFLTNSFQTQHIDEYLTLSFHHPLAIFFESLLILGTGAAIWHASRGSYTEAVLVMVWGHAALLSGRNIPLFAIVVTPIVASAIDAWLNKLPALNVADWVRTAAGKFVTICTEVAQTDAIPRLHLASVAGLAIVASLIYAPAPPPRFRPQYDPRSYPAAAIATLKHDTSVRIFTIDDWGDYLIYRLDSANGVFIDGRFDFYGDDFLQKYFDVMAVKYDWQETLDHFGVNTIMLPPDTPLTSVLKESSRWRMVYDDGIAVVFKQTASPRNASNSTAPAAVKPKLDAQASRVGSVTD